MTYLLDFCFKQSIFCHFYYNCSKFGIDLTLPLPLTVA